MKHDDATTRLKELAQAFNVFNATSRDLQAAWAALEARVAELTRQRDAAQKARMAELAAKERVAERLQSLLEALPAATLMLNAEGRIVEGNAGAHELLGAPLVGAKWQDVVQRALSAESDTDGTPRLSDGRRLNVSRRSIADGGCVLLLTDDSEAHAHRSGVERQRRQSAIDDMNARLAHQLRTPLATAVLYLSRIADGGLPADTCQRLGAKALARLRDLQHLIDGMLALARGERGEAEDIDVAMLLEQVRASAEASLGDGRRLRLPHREPGVCVRGQRHLLHSALLNLVENALHAGDRVQIEAHTDQTDIVISVTDNGPGIPEALATRIFDPFFTTRRDGTGLGLAMARSVIQAHGGQLNLVPAMQGARFVMRLPRAGMTHLLPSGELFNGDPAHPART
ncbi:PAS domain-containing sensor histidine kinase [Oleiagrimonas sp. C23AA]|uniref:sensor histidine kinase n=1 Tax=Oleiagrimonas sp. C23AA TaxID=2719047 RepID=UPI0014211A43|nr:PAS domain-containing sensor histidine kinase [Oleiagrimonas sp. C23AA]NII09197.1 PAS domain-containing protein [Oleiagrimonas sp. C23AA]